MGRLFGTDGVRGTYGEDLDDELAYRLGFAAATVLGRGHPNPRMLIARDTRASGEPLERALDIGIRAAAGRSMRVGVLPTPAVAYLVRDYGFETGAMISASHNPARDNGIKFFGADGTKLPDAVEDAIEAAMESAPADAPATLPPYRAPDDPSERYLGFLLDGVPSLAGLRLVVDCANGAASAVGPEAYRRAGAEVIAMFDSPDGANINDGCGATHPEALRAAVLEHRAHAGLAHDGDADRLIAVDERGEIVDGDQALAICALEADRRGALTRRAVVSTVMANLGFRRAMIAAGIEVVETKVGDRYVLEAMRGRDLTMGGEQSGHIIFLDRHTTGDGIYTALRLLGIMASSGKALSELAAVSPRLPQSLIAVPVKDKGALEGAAGVWDEVRRVESELGADGRVLIRPSGTERVIRVMVEAQTEDVAAGAAERIAKTVETELG